ncbi:hypothetical protein FDP41_010298 [Naegleria fowleri]|uniref:Uncharacterized protein n=1 Tax=Naegleria fowleri TaxID=5763 RepID=A0A6A5BYL9_NAEFO|nr:uncharacterized protein FDP41_010298 [Naegleria fowleri]KAF0983233.1 hypothetical protein FDP41_010298 [Naegleria fowleri]CAG4718809.1 unnamed protein product [Naegleria fowleri]
MGLLDVFHKKTPEELAKEWKSNLRAEARNMDRNIRKIEMEEVKAKKNIKDLLRKGQEDGAKLLARELIKTRKSKVRLHKTKAQINSVILQLDQQLQQLRVMGALKKSTEVMQAMNQMMKLPDLNETIRNMSREMEKAGLIEEMVDDMMDDVLEDEDVEEAADEEVSSILDEVLGKKLRATKVGKTELETEEPEEVVEDEDDIELQKRLSALKN